MERALGDGLSPERALLCGALRVVVEPVLISRIARVGVDPRLIDRDPVADAELLADAVPRLCDRVSRGSHFASCRRRWGFPDEKEYQPHRTRSRNDAADRKFRRDGPGGKYEPGSFPPGGSISPCGRITGSNGVDREASARLVEHREPPALSEALPLGRLRAGGGELPRGRPPRSLRGGDGDDRCPRAASPSARPTRAAREEPGRGGSSRRLSEPPGGPRASHRVGRWIGVHPAGRNGPAEARRQQRPSLSGDHGSGDRLDRRRTGQGGRRQALRGRPDDVLALHRDGLPRNRHHRCGRAGGNPLPLPGRRRLHPDPAPAGRALVGKYDPDLRVGRRGRSHHQPVHAAHAFRGRLHDVHEEQRGRGERRQPLADALPRRGSRTGWRRSTSSRVPR